MADCSAQQGSVALIQGQIADVRRLNLPKGQKVQLLMRLGAELAAAETALWKCQKLHRRCGWIFQPDASNPQAYTHALASFTAQAAWFYAIHPSWYRISQDDNGDVNSKDEAINLTIRALTTEDPNLVSVARTNGVQLIPLVAGHDRSKATGKYDIVDHMLTGSGNQQVHIKHLIDLVTDNLPFVDMNGAAFPHSPQKRGYQLDGLEIDYEHFEHTAEFQKFIQDLGSGLRAVGKVLTVSVSPPIDTTVSFTGDPNSPMNYHAVADGADFVHMMAYDFHTFDGPHLGPVAPTQWDKTIADWIPADVAGKIILGLPNYGIWAGGSGTNASLVALASQLGYSRSDTHMPVCPFDPAHRYFLGSNPSLHVQDLIDSVNQQIDTQTELLVTLPSAKRNILRTLAALHKRLGIAENVLAKSGPEIWFDDLVLRRRA